MTTTRPTRIEIELTEENLRTDSVPIPDAALGFFLDDPRADAPDADAVRKTLTLHVQGLKDPLHTDIDATERTVVSRRWRSFFERHGIRAGDRLAVNRLSRTNFGVWPLPRD